MVRGVARQTDAPPPPAIVQSKNRVKPTRGAQNEVRAGHISRKTVGDVVYILMRDTRRPGNYSFLCMHIILVPGTYGTVSLRLVSSAGYL